MLLIYIKFIEPKDFVEGVDNAIVASLLGLEKVDISDQKIDIAMCLIKDLQSKIFEANLSAGMVVGSKNDAED